MSDVIISALISLAGILVTAVVSNTLIKYRVDQLERKVDKHNNLIERMYKLEQKVEDL